MNSQQPATDHLSPLVLEKMRFVKEILAIKNDASLAACGMAVRSRFGSSLALNLLHQAFIEAGGKSEIGTRNPRSTNPASTKTSNANAAEQTKTIRKRLLSIQAPGKVRLDPFNCLQAADFTAALSFCASGPGVKTAHFELHEVDFRRLMARLIPAKHEHPLQKRADYAMQDVVFGRMITADTVGKRRFARLTDYGRQLLGFNPIARLCMLFREKCEFNDPEIFWGRQGDIYSMRPGDKHPMDSGGIPRWEVVKNFGQVLADAPQGKAHTCYQILEWGQYLTQTYIYGQVPRYDRPELPPEICAMMTMYSVIATFFEPFGAVAIEDIPAAREKGVAAYEVVTGPMLHILLDSLNPNWNPEQVSADSIYQFDFAIVSPDFEINIGAAHPLLLAEIGRFAIPDLAYKLDTLKGAAKQRIITDLKHSEPHPANRFRITRESVASAVRSGMSVENILTLLDRITKHELPQNVVTEIRRYGDVQPDMVVEPKPALMVEYSSDHVRDKLLAHLPGSIDLGEGRLLLPSKAPTPTIVKALRDVGIILRVDDEPIYRLRGRNRYDID